MGTGASKQQPEVKIVVVQSKEDGRIDAKLVRHAKQDQTESNSSPEEDFSSPDAYDDVDKRHHAPRHRPRNLSLQNNYPQNNERGSQSYHSSSYNTSQNTNAMSESNSHNNSSESQHIPLDNQLFKIFRTANNEEYTVYEREDGHMFYVDWEQQKWRVFPPEWCELGTFESDSYNQKFAVTQKKAEREGELIHPFRGKLTTLLRQESLNIFYFFDQKSKGWLPMPLTWERHTPFVSGLVSEIKNTCPDWNDDKSIVASLRQCNYNAEEVISFHFAVNDEGLFDRFKDPSSGNAILVEKLQKQIKELEERLDDSEQNRRQMKIQFSQFTEEIENLKGENIRLKDELNTIKKEQHRQSVSLRQSFGHGSLRLPPIALKMNIMRPSIQAAGRETRTIKFKLQSTKQLLVKSIKSHNEQMKMLSKAVHQLLYNYHSQASEIEEAKALYRKEAHQRRLLFNEIQELRGNIRVFCRCRYDDSDECVLRFHENEEEVTCLSSQGRERKFEFEKVYSPDTTQEKVFQDTCPIITSCADGYNVCIIAYGQTGAGKTYTMSGPRDNPGVNIRSIKELFSIMKSRDKIDYTMTVSMVEVYNESVYNLLASPTEIHEKLQVLKKGKTVIVPGLTVIEVRSMDDVMKIMKVGERNRTTASTKMNTNSSRSHLLVILNLEGHNRVSGATTHSRLTLVDLAGSERISKSEATGLRLVEAAAINKSLSALGQVFSAIRDNALHIPYRNSKLTYLLQPCLGGDAKACMFVNISPLQSNLPETYSTLEFGTNARQVALGQATKHITKHY